MLVANLDQHDVPQQLEGEQVMTASEAKEMLKIGHNKLAKLLKAGREGKESGLPSWRSTFDHRVLLVKRSDVLKLQQLSQGTTTEKARRQLKVSQKKIMALIAEGILPAWDNPLHGKQKMVDSARFAALLAEREAQTRKGDVKQGKDS